MYGAILGDLNGFPYEYRQVDLTDRGTALPCRLAAAGGPEGAGEVFSEKTVLTAALQDGLLRFEKRIPELFSKSGEPSGAEEGQEIRGNVLEQAVAEEITRSLRGFAGSFPLAGYAMDLSIWLFREGADPAETDDPGPAARVSPVAWMFQDDLYMMRRMAVLQAGLTNRGGESLKAADAAACAVFLAIHGSTKDYIASYLERNFGYRMPEPGEMREEILRAGRDAGTASLCLRAAVTAFLHGRDFEDVLRLAVSVCGSRIDTAAVAAIACAIAEAFFGVPEDLAEDCRRLVPQQIREAADAFAARVREKQEIRDRDPVLRERWDQALIRAGRDHPAAVRDNEALEQAIDRMMEKKDQEALVHVLEEVGRRAADGGRVFVPVMAAARPETGDHAEGGAAGPAGADPQGPRPGNAGAVPGAGRMSYRLQAVRTRDGRLWQPVFTSRSQVEKAGAGKGMMLSWTMASLLNRFLAGPSTAGAGPEGPGEETGSAAGLPGPAQAGDGEETRGAAAGTGSGDKAPTGIAGIVFNPGGRVFFLPRETIETVFGKKPDATA